MRRALVGTVLALTTAAHANGRPPGTSTIQFRDGHPSDVLAGLTFGLAVSHDRGSTWQWMCEAAVGYGGAYDPHYIWFPSGVIVATTYTGIHVSRDGCACDDTAVLG